MPQQYYPCSLNVKGRDCLLIGDSPETREKAKRLLKAGAKVTVINRSFKMADLKSKFLVMFFDRNDKSTARRLFQICRRKRILLCALDQPEFCDITNVSVFNKGLLQVTVGTGGASPAISRKIREGLESSLKKTPIDRFLKQMEAMRARYQKEGWPSPERMKKMIQATEGFSFKAAMRIPKIYATNGKSRSRD